MEDIFDDVLSRLTEFTPVVYIDYERESILLEVHKDYLDEVIRLLKTSLYSFEIIFQKEIVNDVVTILACIPQIIDIFE